MPIDTKRLNPLLTSGCRVRSTRSDWMIATLAKWAESAVALYDNLGQWAKAEPLHEMQARNLKTRDSVPSQALAYRLESWGRNLLSQQKYEEAITVYRECLSIMEVSGPNEITTLETMKNLALCLHQVQIWTRLRNCFWRPMPAWLAYTTLPFPGRDCCTSTSRFDSSLSIKDKGEDELAEQWKNHVVPR